MSAEANRAKCPNFAAAMIDVRAVWPDVRVLYVREGVNTLGAIPAKDDNEWGLIDGATYSAAFTQAHQAANRKKRRGE